MKKLDWLLFCGFCYSAFLLNTGVCAYVRNGMPQQGTPMNIPQQQAIPLSPSSANQGSAITAGQPVQTNNNNVVSNIDIMGAAHQAKTAISAFITALNNWEEAQTTAGLLPNNTNLQVNANAYLQNNNSDEEEIKKSKKKKKNKDKKKKKKKKKKNKDNETDRHVQQIPQGQIQQIPQGQVSPQVLSPVQQIQQTPVSDDWKNVIPNKIAAVLSKGQILAAESSPRKSYRLNKKNQEEFRKELNKYRGIKSGERNTQKA